MEVDVGTGRGGGRIEAKEDIMGKFFFDYDDGEFLYTLSDDTAMDFDGHLMMRSGDNFAMDLETGDFHLVSEWPKDDPMDDIPFDQDDYEY